MNLDVESLIMFFKKNTKSSEKEEFSEDAAATTAGGSTSSGKTPKKWALGLKDGPARGFMDDPKHKWTSGRVIGKTGGSDYA